MFKYSAFIENTPTMREWLEQIGYKKPQTNIEACRFIITNGECYVEADNPNIPPIVVNCLGNPELFKAVTAIRDDSDYIQWFTDGKTWYLCESILFSNCSLFDKEYSTQIKDGSYFHKATLEELIEHFKK